MSFGNTVPHEGSDDTELSLCTSFESVPEVDVGMSGFAVYLMVHRAIRFPVNICIQEGKVAVSFGLPGELNILVDSVQVIKEVILTMGPVDGSIVHVTEPAEDLWVQWLNAISW